MATELSVLVNGLKDDLSAEAVVIDGSLWPDNQLARTIRSAIRMVKSKAFAYIPDYTFDNLDLAGNVTVTSTISWDIDPDSVIAMMIYTAARYKIASTGALVRAKQNIGSISTVAGSFSQGSRSQGFRVLAADIMKELEDQIDNLVNTGQDPFGVIGTVPVDTVDDTLR